MRVFAVLVFALIQLASAQAPTGTIPGVARDPSGGAVAGAHVKLASQATGFARSIITSEQGEFSFPALMAGEYEVTVEAPGFERMVRQAPSKLERPPLLISTFASGK